MNSSTNEAIETARSAVSVIARVLDDTDRCLGELEVLASVAMLELSALRDHARAGSELCRQLLSTHDSPSAALAGEPQPRLRDIEAALGELRPDASTVASFAATEELLLLQMGVSAARAAEVRRLIPPAVQRTTQLGATSIPRNFGIDTGALRQLLERFEQLDGDLSAPGPTATSARGGLRQAKRLFRRLRQSGLSLLLHVANDGAARVAAAVAAGGVTGASVANGPAELLIAACALLSAWKFGPWMSKAVAVFIRDPSGDHEPS